jgi:hypothetical protein
MFRKKMRKIKLKIKTTKKKMPSIPSNAKPILWTEQRVGAKKKLFIFISFFFHNLSGARNGKELSNNGLP